MARVRSKLAADTAARRLASRAAAARWWRRQWPHGAPKIFCPEHPKPYPLCDATGECPVCGRIWTVVGEGKTRRAEQVSGPL